MEPIAPIRNMRNAEILAAGQQILDSLGNKGTHWNLKSQGWDNDVIVSPRQRGQIEAVRTDADRNAKSGRLNFTGRCTGAADACETNSTVAFRCSNTCTDVIDNTEPSLHSSDDAGGAEGRTASAAGGG